MATITKLITYQLEGKNVSKSTPGAVKVESTNFYAIGYDQRGKFVRKALGTDSKAEAEKALVLFAAGLMKGQVTETNSKTFRYEELKAYYLKAKPGKRICKHLDAFYSGMKLIDINQTSTVRAFIDARHKNDGHDPSILRSLRTLRAMLHLLRKDGLLPMPAVCHFPMPKDSDPKGQYIPPADFANVLKALPQTLQPAFDFMYATACRLGATMKMTWDMVSADGTVISLPGEIVKTKKPLLIVLTEGEARRIFGKRFRTQGAQVFDFTNYRPEWSKAVKAANLGTFDAKLNKRSGPRIHDCRCSGAINALAAGIDESTVLKIGGWKTRAMLDRYNVQHTDILKAAAARRAKYVTEQQAVNQ